MEQDNSSNQNIKNQAGSHLYLTPASPVDLTAIEDTIEHHAKIALGEFLQTKPHRTTTIEEELQMLEANLNSADQLIQKNAFMMREVKYLMKL